MKSNPFKLVALASAVSMAAGSAFAIPTLTLTSGASTVTFSSASPIVTTPVPLTVGSWTVFGQVVYDGGVSTPFWDMDIDASSTTGSTLTATFVYDGLSGTELSKLTAQNGGSILGGTGVTVTDTISFNNTPLVTVTGLPGPTGAKTASYTPSGSYTLTEKLVITAPNGVQSVSTDSGSQVVTTVPDSASTMFLFGSGLTCLGFLGRFRKQNRQ